MPDGGDVLERAKQALTTQRAHESTFYPRKLLADLVAEVERLRWQIRHGGDHMCDECWPDD